ncbi:MAG: InlB B-repeat-containing protein [Kiritimatiellae bacterium]|nr:InlB B-repeat-containing protein [Kiritimatiellia bacterium]
MRKLLKSLACFATAALVGASAFANYDWYDTSIGIGGIKSNFQEWSRGNGAPDTDLGALTSLTLSSVEMNLWDDDNDRGGVNMFFRLYGDNGQIGGDVDVWLGGAERIEGSVHDFSVSYTGPFDLADAFGVTLEDGKTYYLNMWAKSYGPAGDHWFNGDGDNYHTKFVYCGTPKTYTLVESADDLVVGADYLVVSTVDGAYSAMKNEANGTGIGCLGLADDAISGNTISAASDAIVWQLKPGNRKGQRELYNAAANVFAADSDDLAGRAQLLADGTDALAQWTIDTSALPAVKFYSVSYPDRCLQRDNFAANERFAAYDRAHVAPCLYRDDSTELQTVTFDPNGGTYYDDMLTMKYVKGGQYWGVWKPAAREGYKFLGWFDEDEARVQNGQIVTEDDTRTFTAQWVQLQTVTFDANGGTLRGMESKEFRCDGVYAGFAKPVRDGYTFMGWFSEDGERVLNGEDVTDDAELTLYAHWGQTVRFDANGGTVRGQASLIRDIAGVYSGFAKPVWDGHTFLGWFDENDQRVQNGDDVTDDGERTLYAHWAEPKSAMTRSGSRAAPDAPEVFSVDDCGVFSLGAYEIEVTPDEPTVEELGDFEEAEELESPLAVAFQVPEGAVAWRFWSAGGEILPEEAVSSSTISLELRNLGLWHLLLFFDDSGTTLSSTWLFLSAEEAE